MLSRYVVSQVKHNSYFLAGLALGLWLALLGVGLEEPAAVDCGGASSPAAALDEFAPAAAVREAAAGGARGSVARPRYYSTELGMRAPLLAAVLSTEDALGAEGRGAALNATLGAALTSAGGALRLFMGAVRGGSGDHRPPLPNVVGFTDTREMLRPFHALKYLADNHLDEYDFFFLVSDATFVNARRLTQLVSELSVSQHVYMGAGADDDSHYCSLEGGVLLSNSVLRAVHDRLDWCVRNSYSAQHHENVGRCVLHAAQLACQGRLQGAAYVALRHADGPPPPALADAVTVAPVLEARRFHELHAFVSRVHLQRAADRVDALRRALRASARRHPPHYRNSSWPKGMRDDPGLAPPLPDNRWDHLRWTAFNATHAFMADDHRAVTELTGATADAIQLVCASARGWSVSRWGVPGEVVGGWWRWEPARALRYRLLLRLRAALDTHSTLRQLEVVKPLGAARLVPVPYVTESARVHIVLAARADEPPPAEAFLRRYEAACLQRRANTALVVVLVTVGEADGALGAAGAALRGAVDALAGRHRGALVSAGAARARDGRGAGRAAMDAALKLVPKDALMLLMEPHMDFNEDFLNRVRMNSIPGEQWYLPVSFSRFEQYSHPLFVDAAGNKPQTNTGRFDAAHTDVVGVHRADYERAAAGAAPDLSPGALLAAAGVRCVRAPEPGLVRGARGRGALGAALRDHRGGDDLHKLELGARHTLAKLLLEVQAEAA